VDDTEIGLERIDRSTTTVAVTMSPLVAAYEKSSIAATWRLIWRAFPTFAARWSPFFLCSNGAVLWSQGFGQVAYLLGERSVVVGWGIGTTRMERRILLSRARSWDPPFQEQQITEGERAELRVHLAKKYESKGETVVFQ
jgi:hypothetical protein